MSIQQGSQNNTLRAVAYNTDGTIKTDLAFNTPGISIFVQRIGQANGSPMTLSAKSGTTWAAGAFLNLTNGDFSVDVADANFASFLGDIRLAGTFTGGYIVGVWEQVVAYNPNAVAVGANTVAPANSTINDIYTVVQLTDSDVSSIKTTVEGIVAGVWAAGTRTLTAISDSAGITTLLSKIIGTLAAGNHSPQSGDAFARLGAPSGASIAADIAAIDGGSGLTGPNTVTITVTDGIDPIEDATVRIHRTGYSETKKTNASGVVTFTVDSANWSVSISATGYASETNALTVDGDETVSYSLDAFAVSEPSAPSACVVQCFIYENATPIQNATVKARLRDINSAVNGVVLTKNTVEATTNANGYAELELLRSSAFSDGSGKYVIEVWSQSKNVWAITASIPDQDTVNLEDLLS